MNRPLDQTTQVMGQSTRYWQVGAQGSPLVLIHGLTAKPADRPAIAGSKPGAVADTHKTLRQVTAPTLVIRGRQDRFLSLAHLATLKQHMPQAETVVLDNCGHAPMIEHAAQFTQLTLDFLAKSLKFSFFL